MNLNNPFADKATETMLITLSPNTKLTVKGISGKNNLIIQLEDDPHLIDSYQDHLLQQELASGTFVMHKKHYNQIHSNGIVEGRLRKTDDGLVIFEGFSFR